jgi:hypothetical protein
MNEFMKKIVDLIYGTKKVRDIYLLKNPTEVIFAIDGAKAIVTKDNKEIERGLDWITSQRAVILLTNSKIICGKWTILLDNIQSAQLLQISSILGNGLVLKIQTKDNKHYQFGMQMNHEWLKQKVLPLKLEKAKISNSLFSIVLRIFIICYIAFLIYRLINR